MRPRLCSCNETRPNSCSRSSRSQDRGQSSAATYTTGRKHRDLDRIQDLTQQRQKTDLSSNVPTCVNSLRHYYVATRLSGSNRLLVRANLPRSQRTSLVHYINQRSVRLAIEELDNLHKLGRRLHLFVNLLKIGDESFWNQKVSSKNARRTPPHVLKHLCHLIGVEGSRVNHAEASCLRDRRYQL